MPELVLNGPANSTFVCAARLALDEKGVPLIAEMLNAQRERGGIALLATNDSREAALGDRAVVLGA